MPYGSKWVVKQSVCGRWAWEREKERMDRVATWKIIVYEYDIDVLFLTSITVTSTFPPPRDRAASDGRYLTQHCQIHRQRDATLQLQLQKKQKTKRIKILKIVGRVCRGVGGVGGLGRIWYKSIYIKENSLWGGSWTFAELEGVRDNEFSIGLVIDMDD